MTTQATVKWVELTKGSPRVVIVLRVPQVVSVPHRFDAETGRYKSFKTVTQDREQQAYCWRDSLPGALVASLCERAEQSQQPIVVDYEKTPWGWRLTNAALSEVGPPAGALVVTP